MIKVAMTRSNGEVGYIISPAVDDDYIDGQVYGVYTARHISVDSNDDDYIIRKYWDGNGWVDRGERPSDLHEWIDGEWYLNLTYLFNEVRGERQKKLAMSDWTQTIDSPLSDSKKAEWATYRQALRDVPANNSDATDLSDIIWPTKPE